ncbi:CdaR family protein [Mycoplasma sp. P36-A1]|uniref:CdaR family protein n=1 Tax=Mycoplasma sp. P36-A1 TaxID=3252900 RepID=UPI003C2F77E4
MAKKRPKKTETIKTTDEVRRTQRIEEAKRIAKQSSELLDTNYNRVVKPFNKAFIFLNQKLDFILTNSFTAKVLSLFLAVMLYLSINYSGDINVFGASNVGKNLTGVSVRAIYDTNKYQVEGLPDKVDISLVGNVEAIRKTEVLSKQEVIADLSNYKAGTNQKVELLYSGIASGINVTFTQPTYEVDIYNKVSKKFNITPELIKVPVDQKYSYYDIKLSQSTIEIKAAQHTIDSIAKIEALIDVSGQNKDFSTISNLAIIDTEGKTIENILLDTQQIQVDVKVKEK